MRVTICLGGIAALAMSLPAQRTQQEQTKVWEFLVEKYDANSDGVITAAEYSRGADSLASYDRNRDGVVNQNDFASQTTGGRGRARGRGRGRGGRGGRGGMQMTQLQAYQMVARGADSDGSRDVSLSEWQAVLEAMKANGDVLAVPALTAMAKQPNGNRMLLRAQMQATFVGSFDDNGDGEVTVTELSLTFARLDKDQNNTLEWSEMGLAVVLPQKGVVAPDFVLPYRDDVEKSATLSSFAGEKPVALIFGSYT